MQLDSHKHKTKFACDMLATFALALCVASPSYGQSQTLPAPSTPRHAPLRLNSVEPPNWWIGLPNPMLLIKGENLAAAKVTISSQPATPASSGMPVPNGRRPNRANAKLRGAVSVARTEEGLNGKYLFVWLDIAKSAAPGTAILDVAVGGEHAKIEYPLLQRRRSPQSNFSFASDDLIYRFIPEESDRANPEHKTANSHLPSPLRQLQDKLPDLKDLGFTTVSLPPLYKLENLRRSQPYAPISLYSIDQRLGSLDDFKSLIKAAHELGRKVSVDLVVNQVSHAHPWASDPPTAKWFHGTDAHHFPASTRLWPLTDPHATTQETRLVTEGWVENTFPDLNTEDPWVSQYLRQNAVWWMETASLDEFRLESFPYVDRQFWHDFNVELHKIEPALKTIGDVSSDDPTVTAFFAGGRANAGIDSGLYALLDFPLAATIREVIVHDAPARRVEQVLSRDWLFPHPENMITFIGDGVEAFAEDPATTPQKLKLALSLLLTLRGIPQITGDELNILGPTVPAEVNRGSQPQADVIAHLRALLDLRKVHPALRQGKLFHIAGDDQIYAFEREFAGAPKGLSFSAAPSEHLLIILNNSGQVSHVSLDIADTPLATTQSIKEIFMSRPAKLVNGKIETEVAPRSLAIYLVECGCDL